MHRRIFIASLGSMMASVMASVAPRRLLLRSSWQTVNVGDIAHTPGILALIEKHLPATEVTLWPNPLSSEVEKLLRQRFPKLRIAITKEEQAQALENSEFVLHGSGPGLVGAAEMKRAQAAGKPYGFAGITLSDDELKNQQALLSGAKFIFTRDTDSLAALKKSGIAGPTMEFGPDATFALDLRDDAAAEKLLAQYQLKKGHYLCCVPRLRWTPYWEIHPERVKPNPQRSAINEAYAERDHAKMRQAIIAWVKETGLPVFLVPEMTYEVPRLRPLLYDPLPKEVQQQVKVLDRYWLTAEAASVYARSTAVLSFEMHSPILAVANGTPAILLRQPTDTRKGQMWRDIGLNDWIFEIDQTTGEQIAERVVTLGKNPEAARAKVKQAMQFTQQRMASMMKKMG
jgi:hypothetical protein